MPSYADTSFLVRAYTPHADSQKALRWLQRAREPLLFTPLHRHELLNAIRLRVFRGEITTEQRLMAFQEIESDLAENILAHTPIPWTEAFRESEAGWQRASRYPHSLHSRASVFRSNSFCTIGFDKDRSRKP